MSAHQSKTSAGHFITELPSWLATRAGEPGRLRCAHGAEPIAYESVHRATILRSAAFPLSGLPLRPSSSLGWDGPPRTKTAWEIHTCCYRVRRKRKRLTSNGSIESDAANGHGPR
jgi:hypothetical protein